MFVSLFVFIITFVLSMVGLLAMVTMIDYWFDYCLENDKSAAFAVSAPIAFVIAVLAAFGLAF